MGGRGGETTRISHNTVCRQVRVVLPPNRMHNSRKQEGALNLEITGLQKVRNSLPSRRTSVVGQETGDTPYLEPGCPYLEERDVT